MKESVLMQFGLPEGARRLLLQKASESPPPAQPRPDPNAADPRFWLHAAPVAYTYTSADRL